MADSAARQRDFDTPEGARLIAAEEWQHQRFGWLKAVRRDTGLSAQAQMLAHVLVLDYANKHTLQCDPSIAELEDLTGRSKSTIKRAIAELVEARWITRITGRGRGRTSGYGFLTRASVVPLKGFRSDPVKGFKSGPEKGSNLTRKGFKSDPAYIRQEPCKNHYARADAPATPPNPMVIKAANRAVERFRDGHADALAELAEETPWVLNHILAANLLTPDERERAGLCRERDGR